MPEIKLKGVVIINAELLHPKMIDIIEWLLEKEPDNGLERIIVKHKDGPKGMLGKYYPEINTMVLNLEYCLEKSLERAVSEKDDILGLSGILWMNMIWTGGHETHHAVAFSTDDGAMLENEAWMNAEEEEADAYGDEIIVELARLRPDLIEPPALGEMPFFGVEVMARIVNAIQKGEDWATLYRDMDAKGEIYAGKNFSLTSLREFIRLGEGGPDWEEAPAQLVAEKPKEMAVGETAQPEDKELGLMDEGTDASTHLGHLETDQVPGPVVPEAVEASAQMEMAMEDATGEPVVEYLGDLDAIANGGQVHEVVPVGLTDAHVNDAGPVETAAPSAVVEPSVHPDFAAPAVPAIAVEPATVQTVHTIFKRLLDHLFAHVWNPIGIWKDGKALWAPVDISDIPGSDIVMAYQTNETTGERPNSVPANGKVAGRTFKKATFPGYDIIMNIGGARFARRIMVQSPWSESKYARMANNGEQVAWILDMDVQGDKAWKGHYHNGVWNPKQ